MINLKKVYRFLLVSLITIILTSNMFYSIVNAADSNDQVVYIGGENTTKWNDDGISVTKMVEGTSEEDKFDITLKIKTKETVQQILEDENLAVVIVMDISNTMKEDFTGTSQASATNTTTKVSAALDASESFVNAFYQNSISYSDFNTDKIGFVAFNTNSTQVKPLTTLNSTTDVTTFNSGVRSTIESTLNASTYSSSDERFTNIESGLKRARNMLNGVTNKHKFIVFLSDGLPTTYCTSTATNNYNGYVTLSSSSAYNASSFKDTVNGGSSIIYRYKL